MTSSESDDLLIADLIDLPLAEREGYLLRTCGHDAGLRQRVERKLAQLMDSLATASGSASQTPAHSASSEIALALATGLDLLEIPGTTIGRYALLQKIGEGGCGIVYLAEQEHPVRRQVALKIIKLGLDTREFVARFEGERQALALMEHSGIARVFDAGATEVGRPYFVMELVRGVPITRFCDEAKLPLRDRLQLFISVCQAVQHAHQKGVIHRDLKPSNILVAWHDDVPVPKIIDFGIAKALDAGPTEKTLFTQFHAFMGTPAYISPEQMELGGVNIDTRADIYGLGVLLYELLTGGTPFDNQELAHTGLDAMRKTIRETEPPRPSIRLASTEPEAFEEIATRRGTEPTKLIELVRGDLDWIAMKCLEKDRERRYETANGLAADLKRHMSDEPVAACPPSTFYQVGKLIRRHRVAFVAGSAVAAALTLGLGLSLWQAVRATKAEREQNNLRHRAEAGELAAVRQSKLTDAARAQAEGLVGYLLEDLYDDFEATGRIEVVTRIAGEAVAYYDRLPLELQNADTQRNRAVARMRQSAGLWRQGKSAEAEPVAQAAINVFTQRYTAAPGSEAAAYDLARALRSQAQEGLNGSHDNRGISDRNGIAIRRACALMQPWAKKPDASRRARLLYATILNTLSSWQPMEQAAQTCAEARQILVGLGATDLSDLKSAAIYCVATANEAYFLIQLGRLDEAERLNQETSILMDRLLQLRPGEHAASFQCEIIENEWLLANHRGDIKALPGIAERRERARQDAFRFDPGNALNLAGLLTAREGVAEIAWEAGRITESLTKLHEAAADNHQITEENASVLERKFFILMSTIWREDQCGLVDLEGRLSNRMRLIAKKMTENGCRWPEVLAEFTAAVKYYGKGNTPEINEQAFADKKLALARISLLSRNEIDETLLHSLHWNALLGIAHFGIRSGRYAEVEALLHNSLNQANADNTASVQDPSYDMEPYLLYGIALIRQGKADAAREAVARPFQLFSKAWALGDRSISTIRGMALARYVQALAEPEDDAGQIRRRAALEEAAGMLDQLSDEAKHLSNWRDLIRWVADARAQEATARS